MAVSYIKFGGLFIIINNKIKGKEFLNKAKVLFEELKNKHPMYKEFENNYNLVVKFFIQIFIQISN